MAFMFTNDSKEQMTLEWQHPQSGKHMTTTLNPTQGLKFKQAPVALTVMDLANCRNRSDLWYVPPTHGHFKGLEVRDIPAVYIDEPLKPLDMNTVRRLLKRRPKP